MWRSRHGLRFVCPRCRPRGRTIAGFCHLTLFSGLLCSTIITRLMAGHRASADDGTYLSIVVASRNDSHGGDILRRMRLFVAGLLEQTRQYRFPVELVFVEWNPPPGRPRLHEVLPKPGAEDCLTLRYIIAPPSIHQRFRRAPDIPLFQTVRRTLAFVERGDASSFARTSTSCFQTHCFEPWPANACGKTHTTELTAVM